MKFLMEDKSLSNHENGVRVGARRQTIMLMMIFVLAVIARVLFVHAVEGFTAPPTYDGFEYDQFAAQIARGEGYHTAWGPTAHRPPLYPFLIAGVYRLFGIHNVAAVRILQVFLDAMTCIFIYMLGKHLANHTVAVLASLAAALYPLSMYMSAIIYPETSFLFLLCLALWVTVVMAEARRGRIGLAVLAGILFGLMALARPNGALIIPFAALYPLVRKQKNAVLLAAALLLGCALAILPWTARNYRVFHEFIPLTTQGGEMLWAGNNSFVSGASVIPSQEMWEGEDYPDRGRFGWSSLGEVASSRKYAQIAIDWIKAHPSRFLSLLPRKLTGLWSPISFTTHSERRLSAMAALLWIPFAPFLFFVGIGIVVAAPRWRRWLLPYVLVFTTNLTALLIMGGTRYSVSMVPALLLFATLGVSWVLGRLGKLSVLGPGRTHGN